MLVCMKCHMEYEEGTLYCSNCGGDLVTKAEPKPGKEDKKKGGEVKPDGRLVCPKCHILYEKLTTCIRCGAPLVTQSALKDMKASPPPVAPESKKKESKVAPPSEVKKEPSPIPSPKKPAVEPRREEPKPPHAVDRMREPSSLEAAEKSLEKELPEDKKEKAPHPKKGKRKILQSRIGILFFIFLAIAAIYFFLNPFSGERIGLWPTSSKKATEQKGQDENATFSKEAVPAIPSTAIPVVLLPQEVDRILDLLEDIRQANLNKNINLLMSCYASDFKDLGERRRTALESWSKYNYLDLSYALKTNSVSINSAKVRVEWKIRLIPLKGGEAEEEKMVLDVTLKKEKREWKIKEVAQAK